MLIYLAWSIVFYTLHDALIHTAPLRLASSPVRRGKHQSALHVCYTSAYAPTLCLPACSTDHAI